MKKITIILGFLLAQNTIAFFPMPNMPNMPNMPKLPELPMFGDFNPNQLRTNFNKFSNSEPDFARERRVISQIEEAVMDGDVEYLPLKKGRKVFTIYMESEVDKPKGGVIILHNRGQHANWDDTIKPLRTGLTEKGWHTLSVQMPVLGKEAKYYDYVPIFPYSYERIDAALDFYKEKGITNIVLIAHGCGAHMAMGYIEKYSDNKFKGFVGIGMGATDYKQKLVNGFPLYKMTVPILDIFAEQDFAGVRKMAKYRDGLIKQAGNKKSAQVIIENADHYYKSEGAVKHLTDKVAIWLNAL